MFANTQLMGTDVGWPDVSLTPAAPAPVPIPYPNLAASPFGPGWFPGMPGGGHGPAPTNPTAPATNSGGSAITDLISSISGGIDSVLGLFGGGEADTAPTPVPSLGPGGLTPRPGQGGGIGVMPSATRLILGA
jgi:hypothetical protein